MMDAAARAQLVDKPGMRKFAGSIEVSVVILIFLASWLNLLRFDIETLTQRDCVEVVSGGHQPMATNP